MSSNNTVTLGSAILATAAIVLQSGAFYYFFRKFKKLRQELEQKLDDYNALRDELSQLKSRIQSLECQSKGATQYSVRFASDTINENQSPQPITRVASVASSNGADYADAYDEWPPLLVSISNEKSALMSEPITMKEVDDLHEKGEYKKCYDILNKSRESEPENVELLWRLARACHNYANSFDQKNHHRKEYIVEGHKYALQAYNLNDKNFLVLKWAAVLSGSITDHLGTKEKIQEGYKFKEYLNKALAINPEEYSLLHMRGRYSFAVANLSWFERKAASTFFATPPEATIDEALEDFLQSEKLNTAKWIENLLYLARCYISKGNKIEAKKHLQTASKIKPTDDADRECLKEVEKLLNSISK